MKKFLIFITMLVTVCITISTDAAIKYDFEGDTAGNFPVNWSHFTQTSSNVDVVNESMAPGAIFDGDNSLRISFTGGYGSGVYTNFNPIYEGMIEYYQRVDYHSDAIGVAISMADQPDTGGGLFGVRNVSWSTNYLYDGSSDTGIPVVYGEYAKFNLYFNTYTDTATLYINDQLTNAVDVPFIQSTGDQGVTMFQSTIETDVGGSALWYLDNVSIVPEPISSILFITGGATLGFRRLKNKITN